MPCDKFDFFVDSNLNMIEPEEVKLFEKHALFDSVDVHPTEKALIVNYELEAALVGHLGEYMLEETKKLKKTFWLKGFNSDVDIPALAGAILEKCSIIPRSKLHEVEQLLYYIQTRKTSTDENNEMAGKKKEANTFLENTETSVGNISSLDQYIDLLYESMSHKVKASSLVLQLAREPDNLHVLSKNDILIGALARVLREDGKKSIELSTNIVYIFFCFSTFRQFHHVISQHKVGSICMELVDGELKRYDQWTEEIGRKKDVEQDKSNMTLSPNEYDKNFEKYSSIVKKQDQLLRVLFYLLYNISEDPKVELKMINRGIVCFLVKCLKRENTELLILVISFLKKLSVYAENKCEMIVNRVVENISMHVPHENPDLLNMALRLLWNLSFDNDLRNLIVRCGFVPKFISLMSFDRYRLVVISILYHISMEDRYKTLLTYIDCIPVVVNLIIECPDKTLPTPLIAFGINLAANKRNAQLMCNKDSLSLLMARAIQFRDSLLMKMIRNVSQHECTKEGFVPFVDDLCVFITGEKDCDDFVIECLGVLGNLSIPLLIDFEKMIVQYNFLDFIKKKLAKSDCEDDMILELIIFMGTVAMDEACAIMILDSGIVKNIIDFLNERQEDDEVVLQIVFLFYCLIRHPATKDMIIENSQIPAYLTDLMNDKNIEIRKFCDLSLDIISANSEDWNKKIKKEKFCWHNRQWLEIIESQQIEDNDFYVEDSYTPCILSRSDLLYDSGAYESLLSDGSLSPELLEDLTNNKSP